MVSPNPERPAATPAAPPLAAVQQVVRRLGRDPDGLIEVLHQLQKLRGYLPREDLAAVARFLQLPPSQVYGVASFYHLFRLQPPTAHRLAVCLGTACFVKGGVDLAQRLEQRLGLRLDDPAGDGTWALEAVSCLGACGQAPVLVLDGRLIPRLPVEDAEVLAAQLEVLGVPAAAAAFTGGIHAGGG